MSLRSLSLRRSRRRDEDGAVLVEAAIVMPLVLLLVFGIIEFGIAFWSLAMVEDGARRSGRIAAQVGRAPDYAERIAAAADAEISQLPNTATPLELIIYKANSDGFPGNEGHRSWDLGRVQCADDDTCVIWGWDAANKQWSPTAPPRSGVGLTEWPATDHDVCPGDDGSADRIGVAVGIEYRPTTSMFNEFLRKVDPEVIYRSAVATFEPGPAAVCK